MESGGHDGTVQHLHAGSVEGGADVDHLAACEQLARHEPGAHFDDPILKLAKG